MASLQLYQSVLHFFMDPTNTLINSIGFQMLRVVKFQLVANALMTLALMVWAYQRIQYADMFRWQTLFGLACFGGFFVLFNYAMHHPQAFYGWLKIVIFYGSDALMELIQESLKASSQALGLESQHLDLRFLINQTFHTLVLTTAQITHQRMHTTEALPTAVLVGVLILSQGVLLTLILALVLLVSLEIYLWLALGTLVLPLGFFACTRPMLWFYFKKCLALSFYQPIVVVVAFYNAHVVQTLIANVPKQGIELNSYAQIGLYLILIVSSFLELFLIRRMPDFIHALFHTQGTLKDMANMASLGKNAMLQSVYSTGFGSSLTAQNFREDLSASSVQTLSKQEPSFSIQTLSEPHIDIQRTHYTLQEQPWAQK